MAQTWRFYLVSDAGEVSGTNNFEVAAVAKRDGSTLVIEPKAAEAVFDGDAQMIEEADPDDFIDPDEGPDGDDDEEDN